MVQSPIAAAAGESDGAANDLCPRKLLGRFSRDRQEFAGTSSWPPRRFPRRSRYSAPHHQRSSARKDLPAWLRTGPARRLWRPSNNGRPWRDPPAGSRSSRPSARQSRSARRHAALNALIKWNPMLWNGRCSPTSRPNSRRLLRSRQGRGQVRWRNGMNARRAKPAGNPVSSEMRGGKKRLASP